MGHLDQLVICGRRNIDGIRGGGLQASYLRDIGQTRMLS